MVTRRDLLRRSALLSLTPALPIFLTRTASAARPERDDRVLVVIQLNGGNDGINTVVPFEDDAYKKCRRELRLPTEKLFKVGDGLGLHPSMRAASELLESGRLAIVQGVGYPNPNRSHFESMNIWQTATPGRPGQDVHGWLGRALDTAASGDELAAIHVGDQSLPRALFARRAASASFDDAADLALTLPAPPIAAPQGGDDLAAFVRRTMTTAYATAAELEAASARGAEASARYPATRLATRLGLVARSIKAGSAARVYYAIQPGYDSHSVQIPTHAALLREFSGALHAFLDDLAAAKLADRVVVMAFSEFGRRPEENGSLGTDHGTAGPLFLAGPSVKAGVFGQTPRLDDLDQGDLRWSTDFRSVYATLLDHWLDLPSHRVLGGRFEAIPVLRNSLNARSSGA